MKRTNENIKEFKNGNLSIRFSKEDLESITVGHVSPIEVLVWQLSELDCYLIGDEFCLGYDAMGCMIYNSYSDLVYIMNLNDIDLVLMTGRWLRLNGRKPTEDDRVLIEEEV